MKPRSPQDRKSGRRAAEPSSAAGTGRRWPVPLLAAGIAFTTVLLYLPALKNDFVNWDDFNYIYGNIQSFDWSFLFWAFTDTATAGYWHPLAWISHAIDFAVWGMSPMGHHLTSILLHGINTFLVVLLTLMLVERGLGRPAGTDGAEPDREAMAAALSTGILFGIHPLHVESVAWVAERKDLLFTLFYLLCLIFYLRHAAKRDQAVTKSGFKSYSYYSSAVFSCLLALCSKPMAVTIPAVLLLLDWYPLRRLGVGSNRWQVFAEKLPFLALSIGVSVVTIVAQRTVGAMELMSKVPVQDRVLVACRALFTYLVKIVAPWDLVPFYPYPLKVSLGSPLYFIPILLSVTVSAACVAFARRRPVWLAVWTFFVVTLLPVLGIIQVGGQWMADRFVYLPSLGPLLLVGVGTARIWEWQQQTGNSQREWFRPLGVCAGIAICILLSVLTVRQIGCWRESIGLWNLVISKVPEPSAWAFNSRGLSFAGLGDFDHAIADYSRALALEPLQAPYWVNRGFAYAGKGETKQAMADFDRAITINPSEAMAYNNRGNLHYRAGELGKAREDFATAIALKPHGHLAYNNRGSVFLKQLQYDAAIEDFTRAIDCRRNYEDAYVNRALAYRGKGELGMALKDLSSCIKLTGSSDAYVLRGDIYLTVGDTVQAARDWRSACERGNPDGCAKVNMGKGN